jgi:2-phosphosulfolactate phosphatase
MDFEFATLETCSAARGVVVVIDVLRAFTTAAYAFGAGASQIVLVSAVEQALALRQRWPQALVLGEVGGLPPAGFDFGNSPYVIGQQDLHGRTLILRTGAGTQGAVRAQGAAHLFAASFPCAEATVRQLQALRPDQVTFVITGAGIEGAGDEDRACADYLAARLCNLRPDPASYFERVYTAFRYHTNNDPNYPADLKLATRLDVFAFAMLATSQDGLLVLRAVR